jgi:hydroxymethylbilane synthase
LARWQADHVAGLLGVPVELVIVETAGDQRQDVPIAQIGGLGVFVKEVQAAVLEGRADFAVHSAKDLPSTEFPGLTIAAVPERGDPRDALVGRRLADLPAGATVATGSVRRRAQLANARPDLTFAELRGAIDTRLRKASGFGAIVMAAAALQRLGYDDRIAEVLPVSVMLPQVAQGALAIECRHDDEETVATLARIEHGPSRAAVDAERAFLAELGSGCDLPVGAYGRPGPAGALVLDALIASLDGRIVLRHRVEGDGADPAALGRAVAAHLLDESGGRVLLADLRGEVLP